MSLPFIDVEINVVQNLFVANLHVQVFNMQHRTIVEIMSMTALNAFQGTNKRDSDTDLLTHE
jgi:transcriptional regulator of met regulon